ncbi:primosomal protein N' [Saprospiraceae bacterium]|nr:primosomal protein N' [Saprospiraceae bacterium]
MKKELVHVVQVILPLALPRTYTYRVSDELLDEISFGRRVEVPLRNKLYSGIIASEVKAVFPDKSLKNIVSVFDEAPVLNARQFKFWKWIANYYCCSLGEIMLVALPGGLKLYSETKVIPAGNLDEIDVDLSDDEYMVLEAISIQGELTVFNIQEILDRKSVYPILHKLIDKQMIHIKEELVEKFKPKESSFLRFPEGKGDDEKWLEETFEKVGRSEHQRRALLAFIQHRGSEGEVLKAQVTKTSGVTGSVIAAMVKKGIFCEEKRVVSRLTSKNEDLNQAGVLSPIQVVKIAEIRDLFEKMNTVLLHGVTGSGKTRVFIELIQEVLDREGQVLYLLPEIALTTQIVHRLKLVFGDKVLVYHSKLNSHERVELYKEANQPGKIILGARSAIFMPFDKLELIIVDEEHDSSYKQQDPAPRYNARDLAIVLGGIYGAKTLLGTATPSLESWVNAKKGKFGYVAILERFGQSLLPDIELVDLKRKYQTKKMQSYFSDHLIDAMKDAIVMGRQVILFQNRRGFAPVLTCELCGWKSECRNCDTTLTMHKFFNELRCHYCGFRQNVPEKCPDCGNEHLSDTGFGTEKIELELKKILPDVRIGRMDYDTAKTKNAYEKIIYDFSSHNLDILIGTQMVTKGLDFGKVSIVGILNADKLLAFPDFRASERAFQLMIQVSGRAGRRKTKGKVIIQTFSPTHHIFTDVINNDFNRFYDQEFSERENHIFPPVIRAIEITLKHKKVDVVKEAAYLYHDLMKKEVGNRISSVFEPSISRLRNMYIRKLFIKMEKDPKVNDVVKKWTLYYKGQLQNSSGFKTVRVNIDVDPY